CSSRSLGATVARTSGDERHPTGCPRPSDDRRRSRCGRNAAWL
ncbi:MAG: hypothetical protein AVDCRST_MAG59-2202, partial [uncultured Thermomicrobiales bacterium]